MDRVFVENLTIIGKHGVMGHEWSHEQSFIVDMVADVDVSKSAKTDKVSDTINYVDFCDIARTAIEGESVYLIEKLASIIAERILENGLVKKVEVSIRKPSVLPSGVPGVTVVREQKK